MIARLRELAVPVLIATVTIGTLYACGTDDDANDGDVVYVAESYGRFDVDGDDTITVIMYRDGGEVQRCADMGGTFVLTSHKVAECQRVDQ